MISAGELFLGRKPEQRRGFDSFRLRPAERRGGTPRSFSMTCSIKKCWPVQPAVYRSPGRHLSVNYTACLPASTAIASSLPSCEIKVHSSFYGGAKKPQTHGQNLSWLSNYLTSVEIYIEVSGAAKPLASLSGIDCTRLSMDCTRASS